jgi:hypothetical protein
VGPEEKALKGRVNRQKNVAEQIRPNVLRRFRQRALLELRSRDKPNRRRRKTR